MSALPHSSGGGSAPFIEVISMCSFFFWGVSTFALSGLLNDFFALIAIVCVILVVAYLVRGFI